MERKGGCNCNLGRHFLSLRVICAREWGRVFMAHGGLEAALLQLRFDVAAAFPYFLLWSWFFFPARPRRSGRLGAETLPAVPGWQGCSAPERLPVLLFWIIRPLRRCSLRLLLLNKASPSLFQRAHLFASQQQSLRPFLLPPASASSNLGFFFSFSFIHLSV